MKVVILCGGLGTRLREETEFRPKPMVPVGERPILWHIMKTYAYYGHKEFILCLGYKGEAIKDYFRHYQWNTSDVTLRLGARPQIQYHTQHSEEDWTVTMVDTGQNTMTAVQPPGRFGDLEIHDGKVTAFREKPERQAGFINGGFFVVDRRIGNYLGDDSCVFENEPMNTLAAEQQLAAYEHTGFWQCMDTYREQQVLTGLWNSGKAPWKVW